MTTELEQLYEMAKRNKDNAKNSIMRCRERIREIEKEMSYYEGQRDEADSLIFDIEKLMRGEMLPTPYCTGEKCEVKDND